MIEITFLDQLLMQRKDLEYLRSRSASRQLRQQGWSVKDLENSNPQAGQDIRLVETKRNSLWTSKLLVLIAGRTWFNRSPFLNLPKKPVSKTSQSPAPEIKAAGASKLLFEWEVSSYRMFLPDTALRNDCEEVTFLELDKWIRHSIIAKRRRQISSDNGMSSDSGIWDRLFEIRLQVIRTAKLPASCGNLFLQIAGRHIVQF